MSWRLVLDGIAAEWCSYAHGGGHIERDPSGRVNWQCNRCGRWADPVSKSDEADLLKRQLTARLANDRARMNSPTAAKPH